MKKILLSAIAIAALTMTTVYADGMDDVMQSKSSKQGTDQSQATSRNSPSSKHNQAAVDQAELEAFASVNSDQLAKEIAAGHGEMVDTLATLLKVENKGLFISRLQDNYENIYTSSDMKSSDVLKNISKI
ncbi:MAG: DUF3015 family protein [Sulfurimonas sp.]|jgi:hypothetical protein|nr:DUF3015 family protein [Sulfurimonas sp.]